ncbi:hypothetical protein LAD12857_19520 [Lacrimispora amygdalina]|uniref:Uncharacterized protein n=1 Tax=Lacrimispora amygdalina TaxID=253257 RepID=A0ABQ5M501_9FIRM
MKKNYIQNIVIHVSDNMDSRSLSNKINEFHVEVIERRLNDSNLSAKEKIAVIDRILENLKSREHEGIIK